MTIMQAFSWYILHQLVFLPCHDVVCDALLLVLFLVMMLSMIALVLVLFLIVLLPLTTKLTFSFVVFGNSSHDDGAHVISHGNMFGNVAFIVIMIVAIDFFP